MAGLRVLQQGLDGGRCYCSRVRKDRHFQPTVSWMPCWTSPVAFHHRCLRFLDCCCDHMSRTSRTTGCQRPTVLLARDCWIFPKAVPSVVLERSSLILRSVEGMLLLAGGHPAQSCSGSSQLVDLAAACLGSEVLASRNCPCLAGHASGDPHLLARLGRDAVRGAPAAVVVAVVRPRDHSDLLHARPFVAPGLVAVQMRMRTGWELAAVPWGRVAAIAETACPFLCSMRGGLVKCANRPLCLRLSRRRGALTEDCCTVTWYS